MNYKGISLPESGLVLVAGRPGMGKSYVAIEIANEMNRNGIKAVLIYADGIKSHDIIHYENGEVRVFQSKLSLVNSVYPSIPYVVEDGGEWFSPEGWEQFLNDYIDHEKPQAVFINSIVVPGGNASEELLQTIQRIAKEKRILVFVEMNVSRTVVRRKEKRPKPKDVKCTISALQYVDKFIFVHRDALYMNVGNEKNESIEVYTADNEKTMLPLISRKYAIEKNTDREGQHNGRT